MLNNATGEGFCGHVSSDFTIDGGDIGPCYRSLIFKIVPAVYAIIFVLRSWFRTSTRNRHTAPMDLMNYGVLDSLRIALIGFLCFSATILLWIRSTNYDNFKVEGFMILDAVILTGVPYFLVMLRIGEAVRQGVPECFHVKVVMFLMLVASALEVRSVLKDENELEGDENELVKGYTVAVCAVTTAASLMYICFARDWMRIRAREQLLNRDSSQTAPLLDNDRVVRQNSRAWSIDYDTALENKSDQSPEENAGLFSTLTFTWFQRLMVAGYDHPLEEEDLINLRSDDRCDDLGNAFYREWDAHQKTRTVVEDRLDDEEYKGDLKGVLLSLHRAGIMTPFYEAFFFKIVYDCTLFVNPIILKLVIQFMNSDEDAAIGYRYVLGMLASALLQTFVLHQYFHRCFRSGMRVRSALLTSVYKKALNLTPSARNKRTTGEIVNLMSTDCQRMQYLLPYLHVIWSSPFQVIIAVTMLWKILHYAVLMSIFMILCVMTPIAGFIAKQVQRVQLNVMKVKDERIRVTSETMTSIKAIKMYGWEESFKDLVQDSRNNELKVMRTYVILRAFGRTIWTAAPVVVTLFTLGTFVLSGGDLQPDVAFQALALLNLLQFPLAALPNIFNSAIEASVSLRRLAKFFEAPELETNYITKTGVKRADEDDEHADSYKPPTNSKQSKSDVKDAYAIEVNNGQFFWDDKRTLPSLSNIEWKVKQGELCVVTGEVGAGKTALLQMLIGDLIPADDVAVRLDGEIAYASQVPWILNATLQDNITFGKAFNREWYNEVVEACCLLSDFDQLPHGDQTEIGERGINLSGGQKARVALARVVYSKADIIMLESCFEAVDEHVGAHLWKKAIRGILAKPNRNGRVPTILLVTHALKFMPDADRIVVMKNGQFEQDGEYNELLKDEDSEFSRLVSKLRDSQNSMTTKMDEDEEYMAEEADEEIDGEDKTIQSPKKREASTAATRSALSNASAISQKSAKNENNADKKDLTGEESREEGQVDSRVYGQYIRATGGYHIAVFVLVMLSLRTAFNLLTNFWLKSWSQDMKDANNNSDNTTHSGVRSLFTLSDNIYHELDHAYLGESHTVHGNDYYLGIYAALSVANVLSMVLGAFAISFSALTASRVMHEGLITAMTRSPMSFFDTTPLGRILNRFSKDIYTIDEALPGSLFSFLGTTFNVIGTIFAIAFAAPNFLVALPFLFGGYRWVQKYYIASSREIKRWDSVLRSPIYSHFTESLEGVSAIRAFAVKDRFIMKNIEQLGRSLKAYYASITANRWLAVRLEFIGTLLLVCASFFLILERGNINGSLAGLALTYAMSITQTLNWTVRMVSELETNVVSVERLNEYIDSPPEAPLHVAENAPPSNWPQNGEIVFKKVKARYRPGLENVVKGISFTIKPAEKIGIVGRTGAGKSSLFLILLRIIEPSAGAIIIDGYDTKKLGLSQLRKGMSIIPQDAVMFSGSLRHNLDPLHACSDEQIWTALRSAKLADHIESLRSEEFSNPLDVIISEGGSNFSFGQRQLIAIARAILRNCKVLLMDEATSGVDAATDHAIQETVKTEFNDRTVLTVAHRIETIIHSDRVLVMEKGLVAEFDAPNTLLKNQDSMFSALVKQLKESHV